MGSLGPKYQYHVSKLQYPAHQPVTISPLSSNSVQLLETHIYSSTHIMLLHPVFGSFQCFFSRNSKNNFFINELTKMLPVVVLKMHDRSPTTSPPYGRPCDNLSFQGSRPARTPSGGCGERNNVILAGNSLALHVCIYTLPYA